MRNEMIGAVVRRAIEHPEFRRRLIDSPSYTLNHEEVEKALEEGIVFAENLNPLEAVPDAHGAVAALASSRPVVDACATAAGLLEGTDACFAPILSLGEAPAHPHIQARSTFVEVAGVTDARVDIVWEPGWTKDRMSDAAKLQLGMW